MIPDFRTYINESVWADIHKRSNGQTVRKEDDINSLDRDGLYDYIFSIYDTINQYPLPSKGQTVPDDTFFSIPIFKDQFKIYRLYVSFLENKINKISLMANHNNVKDFMTPLVDKFNVFITEIGILKISAKDGTVSNQVCMDVIETIVENAPHPLLKKRD